MDTHKASRYRDWMIERLGEERFDALILRSNGMTKIDRVAIAGSLVAELALLGVEKRSSRK
jgi:hypothetical protein